jgi:hypothetical protein
VKNEFNSTSAQSSLPGRWSTSKLDNMEEIRKDEKVVALIIGD